MPRDGLTGLPRAPHLLGLPQGSKQNGMLLLPTTDNYISGDRRSFIITMADNGLNTAQGTVSNLLDGAIAANSTNAYAFPGVTAAGLSIYWFFNSTRRVQAVTWYYDRTVTATSQVKYQVQGPAGWQDISTAKGLMTGSASDMHLMDFPTISPSLRMLGLSGSFSNAPWVYEVQFIVD